MFGERLRSLRENANLKQTELAKSLNITSQALSQYELNKRMPDANALKKIADFFSVSVDYLLCRTNNTNIRVCEDSSKYISTKVKQYSENKKTIDNFLELLDKNGYLDDEEKSANLLKTIDKFIDAVKE